MYSLLFALPSLAVQIRHAKEASSGKVVEADIVSKKRAPFECFECGEELILRRGEVLNAHFAHKPDSNSSCDGGGPETWQHKFAKQLLSEHLNKWQFVSKCPECGSKKSKTKKFLAQDNYIGHIEYSYAGFSVDVMVLRNGYEKSAALEVYFTHAVDEKKKKYFEKKNISLFEVEAEQVIDAYESRSFRAVIIEHENCENCKKEKELRNRRPCIQCDNWQAKELLEEIEAPSGHNYPTAFVCKKCQEICPDCDSIITRQQLSRFKRCKSCNQRIGNWNSMANCAVQENNIEQIRNLIKIAPANVDVKYLQTIYEKKQKEHAEQQAQRLANERILEKQLAQARIEQAKIHKQMLLEKAREIVRTNIVELVVPFNENQQVKKYEARYQRGNLWIIPAKHIGACAKWLSDSRDIVPIVEKLLKEQRQKMPGQKMNKGGKRELSEKKNFAEKKRRLDNETGKTQSTVVNQTEEFERLKKASDEGFPEAQFNLAILYQNDESIRDDAISVELLIKAANQGLARAQHNLAKRFETGNGVVKDEAKAFALYKEAARQGLPIAKICLERMQENGFCIPKDNNQTIEDIIIDSDQSDISANNNIEEMYKLAEL